MKQNNTNEALLARWLEGNLTAEEREELVRMDGLDELAQYLRDFEARRLPPLDKEAMWRAIAAKTIEKTASKSVTIKTRQPRLFPMAWRVAAAVALLLGIGVWLFSYVGIERYTARVGETRLVSLPDGSSVHLNAGSRLTFSPWIWSQRRRVNLEGQAYFEVQKGNAFSVVSDHGLVTVLGTKFDVYDRDNVLKVECYEGEVTVKSHMASDTITAGQGVKVSNGQRAKLSLQAKRPAWMSGKLHFAENSLREVFEEIERQYNLDIQTTQVDLARRFTGVIPKSDVNVALGMVCSAMKLSYQKTDDHTVQIRPAR